MIVREMSIRKIFATNAKPTIEIKMQTPNGEVRAAVPIGTSTGKHEAMCLPVDDAIRKFAMVSRHFRTNDFHSMEDVDIALHTIDVTSNFSYIGANVALGISSAFLKAFAQEKNVEVFEYLYNEIMQKRKREGEEVPDRMKMPMPLCNMVGGHHGKVGKTKHVQQSAIQEFLLFPVHQRSFADSVAKMTDAYNVIGDQLSNEDDEFVYAKNMESAWSTKLQTEEILQILSRVAGQNLFSIGMDVAASSMWDGRNYIYRRKDQSGDIVEEKLLRVDQLNMIEDLVRRFPAIKYIEDPFEEDDFISHGTLNQRLDVMKKKVMICGDDLYATNPERLEVGISNKSTNAVIVKPNQIGTITDTIKFAEAARKARQKVVLSHRSGETEDTLISHIAVGLGCDYVKFGISGERAAKLNEIIRIEEKI